MRSGSVADVRPTQSSRFCWFAAGALLSMVLTATGVGLYRFIVGW
jgi:hypothetical protein